MTSTEVEVLSPGAVSLGASGDLLTAAPAEAVHALQEQYRELCMALLDPTDIQTISGKQFKKRSAWRKLAVAFNVSDAVLLREVDRDEEGRIIRAFYSVRVTAPNGRSCEGDGVCDRFERCCMPGCTKGHNHCDASTGGPCRGWIHFSNAEHDIPGTAHTRAKNRACADLFGLGEVSADEVSDRGDFDERRRDDDDGGGRGRRSRTPAPPPPDADTIVSRADKLPEPHAQVFREWRESRNFPWPPSSTAQRKEITKELDRIDQQIAGAERPPPAPEQPAETGTATPTGPGGPEQSGPAGEPMIRQDQADRIRELFDAAGIYPEGERGQRDRLRFCSVTIERDVTDPEQLTEAEADTIIDTLAKVGEVRDDRRS